MRRELHGCFISVATNIFHCNLRSIHADVSRMASLCAWLLGSAFFAGLTAVLGKVGVASINSNLATFIRTVVILAVIAAILSFRREWSGVATLDHRGLVFLVLSGIADRALVAVLLPSATTWAASMVAPIVALAIVLAVTFLGEGMSLKVVLGRLLIVAGGLVLALG